MNPADQSSHQSAPLPRETLQAVARATDNALPDGYGFILIIAPFGNGPGTTEGQYVSTFNRESAIATLKTVLFRWGLNDEWMTNIK